jgi:DNA repair protein RecO (recombination protein O)
MSRPAFGGYGRRPGATGMRRWRSNRTARSRVLPGTLGHVRDNIEVPTYRDEAVVLRTHKLGEADRIITMLSRHRGKLRAVAKGVRRTTSKFGARLEPFSHIDLQFAVGRTLDVVTQVESLDAFGEPLTGNYPAYTAGQVMLETADRLVVEENEPAVQQYLLLVGALRVLDRGTSDGPRPATMILDSYLLRALAVAGYAPSFVDCARCGVVGPHRAFSPAAGGVVCERCRPPGSARPSPETLHLLGALLEGRWADTRDVPRTVAQEASGITAAFVAWHLDRNLRSLAHVER